MRRIRGVTLLETVMATLLVAVVGLSAITGVQFATQRQAAVRANQQMVNWMSEELANLQSQGQRGILSSALDVTTNRDFAGVRGASLRVQTSVSAEAANVISAVLTGSYNDGQARTVSVRTLIFNNRLPRVIGIKFSPDSVPAPSHWHYLGYFPTRNWNRIQTISGTVTGLADQQGDPTTLGVSSTVSSTVDILDNVNISVQNGAGLRFRGLYRGGLSPAASSFTVTLSSIPYARYDLYVYTNLPAIGSGQNGTVQLNGSATRNTTLSLDLSDLARQVFVFNRNVVVFSNQTNSTAQITLSGAALAPPLHGIQIIERN